jgi:hypothetical protein
MKRTLVVLAVLLALGACSKVTYLNPAVAPVGPVYVTKGHFAVFGLVGHKRIPVYQMCPQGVARMQSRYTFVDSVLHFVTFFIYTPRTYVIQCGQGGPR